MDQLSQIRVAVQDDLNVGAESSLYTPTIIDRAVNRAYRKIAAMFKWDETQDALKTSTLISHEYYDYPQNWRPDSIWKITIDGEDFGEPLTFKDYEFEKDNNLPSGFTKIWANYGKRFFVYPVPTTNGDKNISVWGYKFVDLLSLDGDITIFSYSMPEVNEAIVLEAGAILKNRGDIAQAKRAGAVTGSDLLSQEARSIVITAWTKISQEKAKLVRTTPQFDVPDFYGGSGRNRQGVSKIIGNFR